MYDVDGNGTIDQDEMIKIVEAIYFMHSGNEDDKSSSKPDMDILAENVAKEIFSQIVTILISLLKSSASNLWRCFHSIRSFPMAQTVAADGH